MQWMKMLGCLLVAAITTQAQAGIMLERTRNPDPAPGLISWTVSVVGDGENVSTASQLVITQREVHQVFAVQTDRSARDVDKTPPLWVDDWNQFDTSIIIPDSDILTVIAPNLRESNDGSNLAGLDLPGPFPGTNPAIGLGEFDMGTDGALSLLPEAQAERVDLMQVVLSVKRPGDVAGQALSSVDTTPALLSGMFFGSGDSRGGVPLSIELPVPEPASAALFMGMGAVAMLRRRR